MLHCYISDSPTIFIIKYYYFQNTFIHNKNYTLNHLVRHIYLIYKETNTTASSKTILAIDITTRSFDFMDNKGAHNYGTLDMQCLCFFCFHHTLYK